MDDRLDMKSSTGPERSLLFLLVPDGSAARRVRRLVVEQGARSGVVVGSWPELMDWARRAYLVSIPDGQFEDRFRTALAALTDAFWSESLEVALVETGQAVLSALTEVLSATDPFGDIATVEIERLPERPRRHFADLRRLVLTLGRCLPDELVVIRDLLAADSGVVLQTLRVLHVEGVPALSRWQAAVVERLNRDAPAEAGGAVLDEVLLKVLGHVLGDGAARTASGTLGALQSRLFRPLERKAALDGSVQWLGVRDFLQEAEVAAGMAQTLLAEHRDLRPADIGILMPDAFEYAVALEDAFRLGGLALSGLPAERWRRDLGREAVFHFLYCRQKPAPAMAIAVCLSSPLMPWTAALGAVFAQTVMEGDYELEPPRDADRPTRAMLALLREGDSEPASLSAALRAFGDLLRAPDVLYGHLVQAQAAVEELCAALTGADSIDWTALRRRAGPRLLTSGAAPDFNLEGVTVWRESQEPWRAVRHLIVLGFSQGQYPSPLGGNSVFAAGDVEALRVVTGLPLATPTEVLARRRDRFRRQLGAAAMSATLLVPRRDYAGAPQAPSESLVFMHQLVDGPESADGLIIELDASDERRRARYLALTEAAAPQPPRALVAADLQFGRDLLALRADAAGQPKPESPSGLETLMVSRLAWLLRRLNAEPLGWAPESTDPMLLGTLAHGVFEALFGPGVPLPAREAIPERVEALVEEVLRRRAPFLRSAQWKVERRHFTAQTIKAGQVWRNMIEQLGAEVLASEAWLAGSWSGIAIHGQTDLILGLPGAQLLVVDYKRSKSDKRLVQMQKGYDSQASLYRAMLQSGGPKGATDGALVARIRAATQTGVVYYLMNDQVVLSDVALPGVSAIPGWRTVDSDIAAQALALIQQRIGEVRRGAVCLNRDSDARSWEKQTGIKPYALDNSPLISLFTLADEPVDAP